MTSKELNVAEATALLKAASSRGPRTTATEPRTYATWWKLPTRFGNCANPDCLDDRPRRVEEGNTMVAEVNGMTLCRICFLANVSPSV